MAGDQNVAHTFDSLTHEAHESVDELHESSQRVADESSPASMLNVSGAHEGVHLPSLDDEEPDADICSM